MASSIHPVAGAYVLSNAITPIGMGPYRLPYDPTSLTIQANNGIFPLGAEILNTVSGSLWYLASYTSSASGLSANWVLVSTSLSTISSVTGTANQVTAVTTAGAVVLSTPSTFTSPGSVTAASGPITATNGNLVLGTAGNKLVIPTGANASTGTTAAMTGGSVTTATTAVTAASIILYSPVTPGGTVGTYTLTKSAGTSFTITSTSGTETTNFNYVIIN